MKQHYIKNSQAFLLLLLVPPPAKVVLFLFLCYPQAPPITPVLCMVPPLYSYSVYSDGNALLLRFLTYIIS